MMTTVTLSAEDAQVLKSIVGLAERIVDWESRIDSLVSHGLIQSIKHDHPSISGYELTQAGRDWLAANA